MAFYLDLSTAQIARHGRALCRARYRALARGLRRDWPKAWHVRTHGRDAVTHLLLRPLQTHRALNLLLAARALNWAAYERRQGYLANARAAVAHARRERLEAATRANPLLGVAL